MWNTWISYHRLQVIINHIQEFEDVLGIPHLNMVDSTSLCSLASQVIYNLELELDDSMKMLMSRIFPEQRRWRSSSKNYVGCPSSSYDWYSATVTRTKHGVKEGLCAYCLKWFTMRTSHYRYHLQSIHGIDSATKEPFPKPTILRYNIDNIIFGWCFLCCDWVKLESTVIEKREKLTGIYMNRKCWYLHMMTVHGKWGRR
jgi:hypothetical protein